MAHTLELVHRDLHDANVLVYPDRWCVGIWVRLQRADGPPHTPVDGFGRDFYIAPETASSSAHLRPSRADRHDRIEKRRSDEAAGRLSVVVERVRGRIEAVVPRVLGEAIPPGIAVRHLV